MTTHRLPVRIRLTLWYTAMIVLVVTVLAALVFGMLRWRLMERFDEDLLEIAEQTQVETDAIAAAETVLITDTISGDGTNGTWFGFFDFGSSEQDAWACPLEAYQLHIDDVTCIAASAEAVPAPIDVVDDAQSGEISYVSSSGNGDDYRSVVVPVYEDDTVVGALLVTRNRESVRTTMREMTNVLAIASPVLIGLAAGVGYLLAGRALRPVSRITSLAGAIDANDLHQRLDLALPNDELGRLAQTFDAMLARIEDAFERQKRFTGDAAHELRTPLALIRSQVDLALSRTREPEAYRDALRQVDADLTRLTGTVDSLLALARADSGRLLLERQRVDLGETAESVVEQFRDLAAQAGISLASEIEPVSLSADEDMLVQVLVNLVDNAIRFTPSGGSITVTTRADGREVELSVADTGIGIAPEHHDRVFDRFYRVEPTAGGGGGFGLAIAKAIVEAHEGSISLASDVDRGTVVTVRLPSGV